MATDIAAHLARNLKQLRHERGLTQQHCATLASVPRPTWASLESGAANPTLVVVSRVADGLGVSVDELISPPRAACRHYPAQSLPSRRRGGAVVRQLLPDAIAGLQLERFELAVGATLTGVPHTRGAREYLTCERGRLTLIVAGEQMVLAPGDVAVFPGDQKHAYKNTARQTSIAYSVVALDRQAPRGGSTN